MFVSRIHLVKTLTLFALIAASVGDLQGGLIHLAGGIGGQDQLSESGSMSVSRAEELARTQKGQPAPLELLSEMSTAFNGSPPVKFLEFETVFLLTFSFVPSKNVDIAFAVQRLRMIEPTPMPLLKVPIVIQNLFTSF